MQQWTEVLSVKPFILQVIANFVVLLTAMAIRLGLSAILLLLATLNLVVWAIYSFAAHNYYLAGLAFAGGLLLFYLFVHRLTVWKS